VCGFFCGVLMFVAVSCKNLLITVFCIMTFILSGFEHCIADFPYFVVGTMSAEKFVKFMLIIAGNSAGSIVTNILSTQKKPEETAAHNKSAAHKAVSHTRKMGTKDKMKFRTVHENYNVSDLDRSLAFYREALGLTERRRKVADDGSYIIVFIGNDEATFEMELTWLRDHHGSYNLGENEFHLAFVTDDFEASHEKHEAMECIVYENPEMGIYFISDPDGYWLEIIPERD
jgi:lactoylglutathione lyase